MSRLPGSYIFYQKTFSDYGSGDIGCIETSYDYVSAIFVKEMRKAAYLINEFGLSVENWLLEKTLPKREPVHADEWVKKSIYIRTSDLQLSPSGNTAIHPDISIAIAQNVTFKTPCMNDSWPI